MMKVLVVAFLFVASTAQAQFSVLHRFTGDDGAQPFVPVIELADGRLAGTTWHSPEVGTFYTVAPDGSNYQVAPIPGVPTSNNPQGLVTASDGNLYGITLGIGGATGYGTIYRVDSTLTSVYSFQNGTDGRSPTGALVEAPGGLYGVSGGGMYNAGTIFRYAFDGTFTMIHAFTGVEGQGPYGPLSLTAQGDLCGTTSRGGTLNRGVIFCLSQTGTFTVLYNFGPNNPSARLIQAADGRLYGVAAIDGPIGAPTTNRIFRLHTDGTAFETVHDLQADTEGWGQTTLIEGMDDMIYGTTLMGGPGFRGTLFRLSPVDGTVTVLHAFALGADGSSPTGITQHSQGVLYGTTRSGGIGCPDLVGCGVVFRYDTGGGVTVRLGEDHQVDQQASRHRRRRHRASQGF